MKKNEKKVIIVLLAITIIAIIVLVWNKNKETNKSSETIPENHVEEKHVEILEDGTKLNKSDKLKEIKKIDGMEISDFQLTHKDNVTVLLGTITNKSNEKKGDYPINIKILDEVSNEIITVGGYIGELEPGESMQLNSSATFDYVNAYDFEITKK